MSRRGQGKLRDDLRGDNGQMDNVADRARGRRIRIVVMEYARGRCKKQAEKANAG